MAVFKYFGQLSSHRSMPLNFIEFFYTGVFWSIVDINLDRDPQLNDS